MKGKVISGVYFTWRTDAHVFRRWHSFGISFNILNQLAQEGVDGIIIDYTNKFGSKTEYETTVNQFLKSELEYNNHGDQQKHVRISELRELREAL